MDFLAGFASFFEELLVEPLDFGLAFGVLLTLLLGLRREEEEDLGDLTVLPILAFDSDDAAAAAWVGEYGTNAVDNVESLSLRFSWA